MLVSVLQMLPNMNRDIFLLWSTNRTHNSLERDILSKSKYANRWSAIQLRWEQYQIKVSWCGTAPRKYFFFIAHCMHSGARLRDCWRWVHSPNLLTTNSCLRQRGPTSQQKMQKSHEKCHQFTNCWRDMAPPIPFGYAHACASMFTSLPTKKLFPK